MKAPTLINWLVLILALTFIQQPALGQGTDVAKRRKPAAKGKKAKAKKESVEEKLQRVKKRLKAAEDEIDQAIIKHRKSKAQGGAGQAELKQIEDSLEQKIEQRMQEVNQRLENIEDDLDSIVGEQDKLLDQVKEDRLKWSGGFRVTVSNFHLQDATIDTKLTHLELLLDELGQPIYDPATNSPLVRPITRQVPRDTDRWFGHNWVNRLHLTMGYDITENLRFYGRLVVFKYMNEISDQVELLDMHSTRYPRDPVLRLERAHFDWFVTDWLVFSAGRIAAPEGPPAELRENTVRSATWGVQMVEASMEAILVTFHLTEFLESSYIRLFYSPWATHTDPISSNDISLFDNLGLDAMHVLGGLIELKLPHLGENLLQLGVASIPSFRPRNVAFYVADIGEYVEPAEPTAQSLGGYLIANMLLEFTDLAGSGLDLFAAYSVTVLMPNEGRMVYEVPLSLPIHHPITGSTGQVFTGDMSYEIGLASYEEGSGTTNYGHFVLAGFRWTLPFWEKFATKIGAELNYGSKYHVAWSSPSDLLVNRLATKGIAWEVYAIQELVPEYLFLRLGFVELNRSFEGTYIGPTRSIDQTIRNTYFLADVHW